VCSSDLTEATVAAGTCSVISGQALVHAGGVNEVSGVVFDVGVAVEGLWVGGGAGEGVEGEEAAEEPAVEAGLGVVVAGFGVALVGGEDQLVVRGVVPRIAEGIVAHLFYRVPRRIGHQPIGKLVLY